MTDDAWVAKLVELLDGDQWKLADAILEHYPEADYPDTGNANNGLHKALQDDEDKLRREHGIIAKRSYLREVRKTAIAWPRAQRCARVPFIVHHRMRGEGRHDEMAKRLRQAEREGWPLSEKLLARFRADEHPKPMRPYDERLRRAIAAAVRREMLGGIITKRPDWWMASTIVDDERATAVRELRALAALIAAGGTKP